MFYNKICLFNLTCKLASHVANVSLFLLALTATKLAVASSLRTSSNYGVEELLWEKNGDQGRNWLTHEMDYIPKSDDVEVQFFSASI